MIPLILLTLISTVSVFNIMMNIKTAPAEARASPLGGGSQSQNITYTGYAQIYVYIQIYTVFYVQIYIHIYIYIYIYTCIERERLYSIIYRGARISLVARSAMGDLPAGKCNSIAVII